MAFFKFRKDSDEHPTPSPAPESVETLRRRARYRLVGASILVLAGVIGFPLLFDNQPRPISVDIPIEIPDKAKTQVGDLVTKPAAREAAARVASGVVAGTSAPAAAASEKTEEIIASTPPVEKVAAKSIDKSAEKSPTNTADGAKAKALLEGKSAETAAPSNVRYVVQFGAFTDAAKAHDTRMKVEKSGLKTYAQAVQSPEGKKFRVRVGPFERKADAEKAAEKIKKLDLPAAILEL